MTDFKTQMIEDFIPRIKEMIRKEEVHLDMLKKAQKTDFVEKAIATSTSMLEHFKTRLYEYQQYANKL